MRATFRYLPLFLVFLSGLAPVWGDEASDVRAAIDFHLAADNLVVWGSPEMREPENSASHPIQVDFEGITEGTYVGKVFEIDCLPVFGEEKSDAIFQFWAFPTDDTGYGWDEDHPLVLLAQTPLNLSSSRDRVRLVAKQILGTPGWIPQFHVLASYVHEVGQ